MITNLGKLFLMLCLSAVGGGVVANAQIDTTAGIEVNVPFDFTVVDTTLPAGKYEIRRLDENSPNVLELRSADGKRTKVVFETEDARTRNDQPSRKTELVFNKIGDQYFLSEVFVAGGTSASELPKSRMEKRLANSGSQSEKHAIAASMKPSKP